MGDQPDRLDRRDRQQAGAGGPLQAKRTETLDRLTSLRAFAALGVFVFHLYQDNIWAPSAKVMALGQSGVCFFFVLSGFVLVWAHPSQDTPWRFYRRRFARIYPSHLVMLIIAAIVPVVAVARGIPEALASLTLTQAWLAPSGNLVFGMNGVSWTLSCEAFFYAVFPFVLAYLASKSASACVRLVLGWFGLMAIVTIGGVIEHRAGGIVDVNPIVRSGEFFVGVGLALRMKDGWVPPWRGWHAALATLIVAAIAAVTGLTSADMSVALTLPFAGLLAVAAVKDLSGSRNWLTSRWLVYAGQVSFCFYLVHQVVLVNVAGKIDAHGIGAAFLSLAIAIVGAVALHQLVEVPMQRRLRGRQRRPPVGAEVSDAVRV